MHVPFSIFQLCVLVVQNRSSIQAPPVLASLRLCVKPDFAKRTHFRKFLNIYQSTLYEYFSAILTQKTNPKRTHFKAKQSHIGPTFYPEQTHFPDIAHPACKIPVATKCFSAILTVPFAKVGKGKTVHFASSRCGRMRQMARRRTITTSNNNPVFRGMPQNFLRF